MIPVDFLLEKPIPPEASFPPIAVTLPPVIVILPASPSYS